MRMSRDSDIRRLRALTGIKWTYFDEDVVPAWVADMDFLTAPPIVAALRGMIDRGDTGYNIFAHERIPEAWANWSARRYGWRPDTKRVRLFASVLQPIAAVLSVLTRPGDGILFFTPVYPVFFRMIGQAGRRVVDCPLDPDGWRIDANRLRRTIDDTTRAIVLCQPHNPVGRVFDAEELSAVASIAEEFGLPVISDEIWQDLVFPGSAHVPFSTIGGVAAEQAITVTAASKTFSLGGLNCGVAHFGDSAIADAVDELFPHLLGGVNAFGAHATLAAWTQGESWLEDMLRVLESNRERLAERLARELPSVGFDKPQSTYLAWLDFRRFDLPCEPAEYLLEHGRVALSPGPDFGEQGHGFARLNFATTPEILDEVVDRIVSALSTA